MNGKSQKVWLIVSESDKWEWRVKLKRESEKLDIGFNGVMKSWSKQTYQYPCQFIDLWLAKCWSWRYVQKANMFDMEKVKVKLKYLL